MTATVEEQLSSPSSRPTEPASGGEGPWSVTVAGTIGFDDLTTPAGSVAQVPGGSALYFTLATLGLSVARPVAAVGGDGQQLLDLLRGAGVDGVGVVTMAGPSYRWNAVHGNGPVPESEVQNLGVYAEWSPRVPETHRESEILFLGSMPPRLQLAVMGQVSGANLVAIDTMRDFIASDRQLLLDLITSADLFFANRAELAALMGNDTPPLLLARSLLADNRLRAVVVKEGPAGATLVTRSGHRLVPAHPVNSVVDPTGAGDALAGGMLGTIASLGASDEDALAQALEEGVRRAALAISAFGVEGLLREAGR